MSRKLKERKAQLASREAEIKESLLGRTKKANRIKKNAVYGGVIMLTLYFLYRSVSPRREKVIKKRNHSSTGEMITEKGVTIALTVLGRVLESYLKDRFGKQK
ncbi:MAG: hypothetical protein AAF551_14610 [Bacteroidota bacterium]